MIFRKLSVLSRRIRLVRIFQDDPNAVVVEKQGARSEWDQGEGEVEMGAEDDDGGDDSVEA